MGIHHITAIAGEPQRNLDFYAGILPLAARPPRTAGNRSGRHRIPCDSGHPPPSASQSIGKIERGVAFFGLSSLTRSIGFSHW